MLPPEELADSRSNGGRMMAVTTTDQGLAESST